MDRQQNNPTLTFDKKKPTICGLKMKILKLYCSLLTSNGNNFKLPRQKLVFNV